VLQSFPERRDLGITADDRPSDALAGTARNRQKTIEKNNNQCQVKKVNLIQHVYDKTNIIQS
jgi:hypothetical protein